MKGREVYDGRCMVKVYPCEADGDVMGRKEKRKTELAVRVPSLWSIVNFPYYLNNGCSVILFNCTWEIMSWLYFWSTYLVQTNYNWVMVTLRYCKIIKGGVVVVYDDKSIIQIKPATKLNRYQSICIQNLEKNYKYSGHRDIFGVFYICFTVCAWFPIAGGLTPFLGHYPG